MDAHALIDGYDAALFDLDGVIYLGPQVVPGATELMANLRLLDKRVLFVTNNAARPAQVVIDQLLGLGIYADDDCVLTSAQVAATALGTQLDAGSRLLVCGSPSLVELLREAGFRIVTSAAERPAAVIQGYDPDLNWGRLDEAALALQAGALWFACNNDASRPTDRGLVPGVGGAIAVLATALGGSPTIFGKPFRPMLDEAIRRTGARRAIFVGDRLDTDVAGANRAGLDSLMVFSGAHGKADLVAASVDSRPSYIGADVGVLLEPPRVASVSGGVAICRGQQAAVVGGRIEIRGTVEDLDCQLDALWAITQLAWRDPELDSAAALAALELVS